MAVTSKNSYPKAVPLHSPEELATQNNRLSQLNEELAAQTRRLKEWKEELEKRAARLRRWTLRLVAGCTIVLLLSAGAVWFVVNQTPVAPIVSLPEVSSPAPVSLKPETLPSPEVKKASTAKPQPQEQKAAFLEALGGLSATHLYQSHLNIGLLADGVESETYTIEEAEKNLRSVVELMKLVDAQQTKLAKSGLDPDDQDSIRQIQAVSALLHLQVDSLKAYWATEDVEQANQYHIARKASWQGLTKVLGFEK